MTNAIIDKESIKNEDKAFTKEGVPHQSRDSAPFICGFAANMTNIIATFPLNKLMFRQQLYGVKTGVAMTQIYREGASSLYRGLIPPLLQKSSSVALMFGLNNYFKSRLVSNYGVAGSQATVVSGMLAGTFEAFLTPFERVQTLLQHPKYIKSFSNTQKVFSKISGEYGVKELYRGYTAILYRNSLSTALFFTMKEPVKELVKFQEQENKMMSAFSDFISGSAIGGFISTVFFPVNVVKTRMQSQIGGSYLSFTRTLVKVFNERNRSLRMLYRGVHLNLIRSMVSWGIINTMYEVYLSMFKK